MLEGKIKWTRNIRITVFDLEGNIIKQDIIPNTITILALNLWQSLLAGDLGAVDDGEIYYMDVGNDATPPTAAQTTLVNALDRKALTNSDKPADGQFWTMFYIAPGEYNYQWEELGFFAGSTCTAFVDTGTMIARVLYSHLKNTAHSVQIERLDKVEEI